MTGGDDRERIGRCARGEPAAWDELVERFGPAVYGAIRNACRARSVDLSSDSLRDHFQEFWALLWQQRKTLLGRYDGRIPLSSYLGMIAFRRTLNRLRDERRRKAGLERVRSQGPGGEPSAGPGASGFPDRLVAEEDRALLHEAISELSPRERMAVRMAFLEGLSVQVVASRLGLSPNSVGPLLSRIKETLRKRIEKRG